MFSTQLNTTARKASTIASIIHDLAYNLDHKSQIDMILLDFIKAFDKVSHRHLLLKLGVRGNILNWITSFLTGRKQSVVCGGCPSSSVEV